MINALFDCSVEGTLTHRSIVFDSVTRESSGSSPSGGSGATVTISFSAKATLKSLDPSLPSQLWMSVYTNSKMLMHLVGMQRLAQLFLYSKESVFLVSSTDNFHSGASSLIFHVKGKELSYTHRSHSSILVISVFHLADNPPQRKICLAFLLHEICISGSENFQEDQLNTKKSTEETPFLNKVTTTGQAFSSPHGQTLPACLIANWDELQNLDLSLLSQLSEFVWTRG